MFTCILSRFANELDDVAMMKSGGERCICVLCFARETDNAAPMSKELRRQIVDVLSQIDVAA
jgi:hypothetical protein